MYASLTPASSAKDTWCHLPSEGLGGGLYAHVYERQPSLPPSPGAGGTPPNLTNSSLSDGWPLGEEARGEKKAAAAIYHKRAQGGISERLHAPPSFAAGVSGRQKVTVEKRDCRQAAKQDVQNAAGEGKMNVGVTVKNCFPKVAKNIFVAMPANPKGWSQPVPLNVIHTSMRVSICQLHVAMATTAFFSLLLLWSVLHLIESVDYYVVLIHIKADQPTSRWKRFQISFFI